MAQNPKYDNDMVNLGYLNKRLGQTEESINENNNSISRLPKNYSIPPNPPYYKDSLLCYGNKIYRCNTTKLQGIFSWNDWTIVATDDTTISDFINNTYELDKLEIQEQIDGKIQTYYQETDPSIEWTTDLDKGRHVGDYWYNTTNDTQWRYNQITTTSPITYEWGQVNIPKAVFDTIDAKKSIYTEKPSSYNEDDLWIIEETLSDEDLPVGTEENPIVKGDWVFSTTDSETFDKSHWVKRDEDVSLSYLEQHYYTITEIDSSLEVIERNTESKITKATEEISLNVSQTYTTKEEHNSAINDFDEQIGTINQTITEHKETLSDLSVEVGEVSASVETVETRTEELIVDVNGVKENIVPTATATGSSIYVEDASDNPLIQLEIEGKSTQETRSGRNLFNASYIYNPSIAVSDNGAIITMPVVTSGNGYTTAGRKLSELCPSLKVGDIAILSFSRNSDTGYNNFIFLEGNNITYNDALWTNGTTKTITQEMLDSTVILYANRYNLGETEQIIISNFQIELGEIVNEWEQYGIQPSQDYPSEIESVGYENLFDKDNPNEANVYITSTGEGAGVTTNDYSIYILCKSNTTYTISSKVAIPRFRACSVSELITNSVSNLNGIAKDTGTSITLTTGTNDTYLYVNLTDSTYLDSLMIIERRTEKSYIQYGKYGIEVNTTSDNLYDENNITSSYYLDSTGTEVSSSNWRISNYIKVIPNNIYKYSGLNTVGNSPYSVYYDKNKQILSTFKQATGENKIIIPENTCYVRFSIYRDDIDFTINQCKTLLIVLNEPLRSLPNEVKDIAYIKNNMLYVDRYIDTILFDGSQGFNNYSENTTTGYACVNYNNAKVKKTNTIATLSNKLLGTTIAQTWSKTMEGVSLGANGTYIQLSLKISRLSSQNATGFTNFFKENPTKVQYELAEPYTEVIGEIEIPSTFKGINNITTTDDLEPTINIEYVRDTVLSKYVEGQIDNLKTIEERHYADLSIQNDNIKASVSETQTSLDGAISNMDKLESTMTSQSATLEVISKNIDTTTGEVREVTTTTGFTFNAEGSSIKDSEGYEIKQTPKGAYYKDGDKITGQYTKDGSKQKDLELFGTYSYGKDNIDDTPMFVAQLYTDENGEECFGHFYNGGDY